MHPFQVISGFLGFVLITSKEIVWFRPWTGSPIYNTVVSALFAIHFLSLFTRFDLKTASIKIRFSLKWEKWPGIDTVIRLTVLLAAYFIFHEFVVGDSDRGFKYAVYTIFLITLLVDNYDLQAVCKVFAILSVVTSVLMFVQCLLVAGVLENNLIGLDRVVSLRPNGAVEFSHVNPFWMGLIGDGSLVQYGAIEFHRANALTTEPKYCSQVLVAGLVSLLYVSDWRQNVKWIGIAIIAMGLLVSHAYSMIGVFAFALLLYRLGHSKKAVFYSLVAIVLIVTSVILLSNFASAFSGYASIRIAPFLKQMAMADEIVFREGGIIGRGIDNELANKAGMPPFMRLNIQMGIIGTVLVCSLLFLSLFKALNGIYMTPKTEHKWVLALSCSLIFIFNVFFVSEPISPMYSFLLALIFRVSGKWSLALKKAPSPYPELINFAPSYPT